MESICASAGRDVESATRPLMAPIYQGSVFEVESLELLDDIYAGKKTGSSTPEMGTLTLRPWRGSWRSWRMPTMRWPLASGMGAIGNTLLSMVEDRRHGFGGGRAVRGYKPASEATSAEARGFGWSSWM